MKISEIPVTEENINSAPEAVISQPGQAVSEVKRAEKPIFTNKKPAGSFNLKTIFDKVEEEKPVVQNPRDLPSEKFTEGDVSQAWDEFLENLKIRNEVPAYNALHTARISLKGDSCICFEFSSLSLASEFDLKKEGLMTAMRERLNNHFITFEVNIDSETTQNYVKSKAEIFREMAEKNPVLLKMKNEFGLDFNSND